MYQSLLRYKGLVISTAVLLLLVILYALISSATTERHAGFTELVNSITDLQAQVKSEPVPLSSQQATFSLDTIKNRHGELITGSLDQQFTQIRSSFQNGDATGAMTKLTNLSSQLNAELNKKSKLSRYVHIAAIILLLVYYAFAVIPQILKLSQNEEVVVESRKEAENILATVTEGLFLLGTDHKIGIEQSNSLKEFFRLERDLEGDFFDFMGQYVTESTIDVARDYMQLLFGERVKEKLIKDLNPLNEVEINITRRDGNFENRYLNFNFSRVMDDGSLSHVLGSVTDVTREVQLRRELESTKEEQEAQLDLLMQVLHLDQGDLRAFFNRSEETLNSINTELEGRGHSSDDLRKKIKTVSAQAHRIKGDAAALGLHGFEFSMHEFETALDTARNTSERISGRDLLPAVSLLKSAFSELENMRRIVTRFSEAIQAEKQTTPTSAPAVNNTDPQANENASLQSNDSPEVQEAAVTSEQEAAVTAQENAPQEQGQEDQIQELQEKVTTRSSFERPLYDLVAQLEKRRNVSVNLRTAGLADDQVPADLREVLSSTAIQLIRNSIAHGAQPAEQRAAQNKPEALNILVSLSKTDKGYTLTTRDDGNGLDEEKLLKRGVELGLIPEKMALAPPPNLAQKLIFHNGFSSQTETDLDAGRGVGLSAVYSMVREAGGVIAMRHKQNEFCQFNLVFNQNVNGESK